MTSPPPPLPATRLVFDAATGEILDETKALTCKIIRPPRR